MGNEENRFWVRLNEGIVRAEYRKLMVTDSGSNRRKEYRDEELKKKRKRFRDKITVIRQYWN